jgi:uncharacterized SAM-binding protein YcdF (DUF218 family)
MAYGRLGSGPLVVGFLPGENAVVTFALLKTLAWLALPSTWVMLGLGVGVALLWLGRARAGRALITAGVLLALAPAALPLFGLAALPLENRYPLPTLPERIDGIVVLGGAVVQDVTAGRGAPALNDGAERMTEAVRLANAHPEATLLFTGGSGRLAPQSLTEAEVARRFFAQHGVEPERLLLEDRSRDTRENARLSFDLARPQAGEVWVLVTSAMHLPRAVGAFEAAGWTVVPYPVDYRTTGAVRWGASAAVLRRLRELDGAVGEWVATLGSRWLFRAP